MNYKKNRLQLIEEMKINYGYIFCQKCHKNTAFKFHCHHIIFRSEKPGHKNLHNKKNLIICCNECHDLLHTKKHLRNKLIADRNLTELFNDEYLIK